MEKTDEQLVTLVKKGDELAMEELFVRYKPILNKICHSFFVFGAEPEDLMQEAMMGLYKACLSYENKLASFQTFASVCIKRKVLDAVKKANRINNKILNESLSLFDEEEVTLVTSEEINPDERIIEIENFNELKNEIFCKLSDFELLVLKYYLQKLSYSQIAKKLNRSPKSIDNALSRIKQKLQPLNE